MLNKCLKRGRPEAEKIMIKKTIKIPLFWKIYITVVTIVLIGFVVLWSILWTALKKYEQSRPEYAMDKVTEQIQLQDTGDFTKYVHTGENAYEGSEALDEAVREYIKNVLCEGEWAYTKKSGEYTNDNPVYQLKKDGQKTDIIIYLEKNSKNEWTIADVSGLSCEGKTYEIIVPENSEVTVDGNKLGSEYVTETKDAEVLSNVAKHINMPKTTTYHIENVYKEHEIKATGPVYNSELELISSTDNVYEFGFEANSMLWPTHCRVRASRASWSVIRAVCFSGRGGVSLPPRVTSTPRASMNCSKS